MTVSGVRVHVDIDATPERIWEVVEPVENHVEWMSDAVAIRFLGDQRRGTGTVFLCDTRIGPFSLVDEMTITAWEPARRMGVRHTGLVTGSGDFFIEAIGDGRSRFTWEENLEFPLWMAGPLGAFVAGKTVLRFVWRRNLRALKRIVESGR